MNGQILATLLIGVVGIIGLISTFYYRYNLRAVGFATFLYSACACIWNVRGGPHNFWFMVVALPTTVLAAAGYLFSWHQSHAHQLENIMFAVRPERNYILGCANMLVIGLVGYKVVQGNAPWQSLGYLALGGAMHFATVITIFLTSYSRRITWERGPRVRGCLHGEGESKLRNGELNNGVFENGVLRQGRSEIPGKGYAEGTFGENGSLINGEIHIDEKDVHYCHGSMKDGKFSGNRKNIDLTAGTETDEVVVDDDVIYGTAKSKDGYSYEGHYQKGEQHGLGICRGPNGKHQTGTFEKDALKNGTIDWVFKDGATVVGTYQNGKLAYGTWRYPNGQTETGLFWPSGSIRAGRVEFPDGGMNEGWFSESGRLTRGKQILETNKEVLQGRFTETPKYVLEESFLYSLDNDADYEAECTKFSAQQVSKPNEANWESLKAILSRLVAIEEKCKGEIGEFINQMDRLSRTKVTRIAVIGEFNSGKSSFINSLLGEEVSRTADDECTAIPILIGHDPQKNYFGITSDWTETPISKIDFERFQTQGCNDYKYLKVIGPYAFLSRLNIEIIDTPGVSSKVNGRTEITLGAVNDADGCFLLMDSAQDGSKSFLEFADKARQIQPRMFFFVSRADMRSDEEIREHIEITVPKNAKRFQVPEKRFLLVGKTAKTHVHTASMAIEVITKYLLGERANIQSEKITHFSTLIRSKLVPHITSLESDMNARFLAMKDLPDNFRQIWQSWRQEIHQHDWATILRNFNQKIEIDKQNTLQDGLARIARIVDGILFLVDANDIEKVQKIVDSTVDRQKTALYLTIRELAPNLMVGANDAAKKVYSFLESKGIKQKCLDPGCYDEQFRGPEDIDRYLREGLYKFIGDATGGAVSGNDATSNTRALSIGLQFAFRMDNVAVAAFAVGAAIFEGQNKKRALKSGASECLDASLSNLNAMASEMIARIPGVTEWLFEKASRMLNAKYSDLFVDEFTKVKVEKARLQELHGMIALAFEICNHIGEARRESEEDQRAA